MHAIDLESGFPSARRTTDRLTPVAVADRILAAPDDYYTILQLARPAADADLKRQHRHLARLLQRHTPHHAAALLNRAHTELTRPVMRRVYHAYLDDCPAPFTVPYAVWEARERVALHWTTNLWIYVANLPWYIQLPVIAPGVLLLIVFLVVYLLVYLLWRYTIGLCWRRMKGVSSGAGNGARGLAHSI